MFVTSHIEQKPAVDTPKKVTNQSPAAIILRLSLVQLLVTSSGVSTAGFLFYLRNYKTISRDDGVIPLYVVGGSTFGQKWG